MREHGAGGDAPRARVNRRAVQPVEYRGLIRIGSPGSDGGYVVAEDLIRSTSLLISLGLGINWSFDEDFTRRNPSARLIGVDHTVHSAYLRKVGLTAAFKIPAYALILNAKKARKWTERLMRVVGYKKFFGAPNAHIMKKVSAHDSDTDVTLATILAMAPPNGELDVFLKMDIEGSEYDVVPEIVKHRHRINGMAIEFHFLDRDPERFNAAIVALREYFEIVHIHASDPGKYDPVDGFPAFVEISFVNKLLFREAPRAVEAAYPRAGLDVPGDPRTLRFG